MKPSRILSVLCISVAVISCGASKRAQQNSLPPQGYYPYPNYGGYYPQGQPVYTQQAQMGIQQNQQPVYQQQYQSQPGPDAAGFIEIRKSPIEELSLAVGTNEIRAYGEAESANAQLAMNAARAQAIAALQEKIQVYVRAGLDRYAQETGVNSQYSLDELTRNQVQTAVKAIVEGASVLDSRQMYNPNTKRYKSEVCVKYDRAGVLSVMQQQSDRIRANEKKFEEDMQQAWDALDAQNGTVSLQEQQEMRRNETEQNNLDRQHKRDMEMQSLLNQQGNNEQAK